MNENPVALMEEIMEYLEPSDGAGRITWADGRLALLCVGLAERLDEAEKRIRSLERSVTAIGNNEALI